MNKFMILICTVLTALASIAADAPQNGRQVRENFDADPKWEGFRNHLIPDPAPVTKQDFGYSPTAHVGGKKGEIGGRVQRSAVPAWYAKVIEPKTLDDKLKASGKFAVTADEGNSGVLIGWFNADSSRGWRTPNSLAFRIDGNGGKYWVFYEYGTQHWLTGGAGCFEGERYQTTPTKPFAADGTVHEWTLEYDPQANSGIGRITFTLDGKPYTLDLQPEHRADGATFNRFGIFNQQISGAAATVYLDEISLDGAAPEDFSGDPGWEARGNRIEFPDRIMRPYHDFGYSGDTNHAGGKKGEVGGVIWRDERPAYYAAETRKLTLDDELFASGRLAFTGAGSDSGVYIGWFDSQSKQNQSRPQHEVPPTNMMTIMVEGPSRIGHYFRPAFWNAKGTGSIVQEGPIIRPDGKPHTWSIHYDPRGADGRGRITWRLDDVERSVDLEPGVKEAGATFDRFGLLDAQSGGHYVFLYLDDLTYTAAPAKQAAAAAAAAPAAAAAAAAGKSATGKE